MPDQPVYTFDDLLNLILAPFEDQPALGELFRNRFELVRHEPEDYGDELHALGSALNFGPNDHLPDWWSNWTLCVYLDVKDSDQVEAQSQAIAQTLNLGSNLESRFQSSIEVRPCETVEQLIEAAKWFRPRGYELVSLDTQSSDFVVVPVRLELLGRAFNILDGLGIRSTLY
jgi:hypothetical protein